MSWIHRVSRRSLAFIFLFNVCFVPLSPAASNSDTEVWPRRPPIDIRYSDLTVETASRTLQYKDRVPDQVTVITREELEKWAVRDLDEAIGMVTGVVVRNDGLLSQNATVQIHGSKPQEVRVLVDGIPFNPTSTGGIADLSQIPLGIVEKIEIIKGPSSSVWGSAMGGVINIITKPTGRRTLPAAEGEFSWGEHGLQRNGGEVSGKVGSASYYAYGSHAESEGFRPSSEELENRAFLKGEAPLSDTVKTHATFGYSGTENGEFEFPLSNSQFSRKVYSRYGSAGAQWDPSDNWHHEATYKISERRFRRDFRLLPSTNLFRYTKARSLIHEVSAQSVWGMTENQTLVAGMDVGIEGLQSAIFQFATPSSNGTTLNETVKGNTRQGYYLNYQATWDRFDFTLGSRLDSASGYGQNFDPSAGLVYHFPFYETNFRANVARAFNAPSLVDRYVSVGTLVANPDLEAEKAVAYNLGFDTHPVAWLNAKTFFFQTFLEDAIETLRRSDGLSQPVNLTSERRTGFESELALGPWFGFSPSYGFMAVRAVEPGHGLVAGRPAMTQDAKLNYRVKVKDTTLNAHLAGRYTDLVTGSGATDPADQTFLFDGKISLALPKIRGARFILFLLGKNLFNQDYSVDPGNYPHPGRNFEAGFKIRLFS